ncbi:MAG TPA: ATP-binding cassette domain-containing protein [Candidatus Binatia bacterium]|nr:ATP-binding cassette domain-containing protein [Candidatus Binatia bacterium]
MRERTVEDPCVALSGVRMAYGPREVFHDLSCACPRGRITVILGGSGSGKSTILRLIGGLVRPQAGRVLVDGEDVTRLSERELYHVRSKLGMMFQGGALLDSLTVFENLAFPLREHTRLGEAEIASAVHRRLEAVGLTGVDALLPGQLSGGMMRRVALARAIVRDPVILLCDEPFSGLDPVSVRLIEGLLRTVNARLGSSMIVVSHHIPSTMRLADHVILLLPHAVVEGSPEALRRSPDPEVAAFLDEGAPGPGAAAEAP